MIEYASILKPTKRNIFRLTALRSTTTPPPPQIERKAPTACCLSYSRPQTKSSVTAGKMLRVQATVTSCEFRYSM